MTRVLIILIAAAAALFAVLAAGPGSGNEVGADVDILRWLHRHDADWADSAATFVSEASRQIKLGLLVLVIAIVLFVRGERREGLYAVVATVGAFMMVEPVKGIFDRRRPDLWTSVSPEPGFSFPSGHSLGIAAVSTALALALWRTPARWPALILGGICILLVGTSRMYLGVHFPSDVLAGWALGILWSTALFWVIVERVRNRSNDGD